LDEVPAGATGAALGFLVGVPLEEAEPPFGDVVVPGGGVEPPVPLPFPQPVRPIASAAERVRTKSPVDFRVIIRVSWIKKEEYLSVDEQGSYCYWAPCISSSKSVAMASVSRQLRD
jgi:hypothetical protein